MRVSTNQMQRLGVNAILEQQARVSRTQLQLSTGRRLLAPADDPAAAARVLDLRETLETTRQYQRNADAALARLGLEENALVGVANILQRVRELALQANNDSQNDTTRAYIAREVRELLGELIDLANTRDANGEYLFAGYRGTTQPFVPDASGGVTYNGDDGSRLAQIGPTRQVATGDSGTEVFRAIKNGNGTFKAAADGANTGSGVIDAGTLVDPTAYVAQNFRIQFTSSSTYDVINDTTGTTVLSGQPYASGAAIAFNGLEVRIEGVPAAGDRFTVTPSTNQNLFTTVRNLAAALEAGSTTAAVRAQFHNTVNGFLADVDRALENILDIRARIGARMNAIENQKDANDGYALGLNELASLLEDLDFAEAAGRLNLQLTALQAAQQAFLRVQDLSLFNFLR
jgi:flagellar hook-associated protein 3 FlgL